MTGGALPVSARLPDFPWDVLEPVKRAAAQHPDGLVDLSMGAPVDPVLTIDNPAIVVEAVKLADDRSGDVVVRLYEALGSTARGAVVPGFEFSSVVRTDLLERPYGTASTDLSALRLRPFEVVTLRFAR